MSMPTHVQIPAHLKPKGTSGQRLLEIERSKASFSSEAMAEWLHGREYLDRQRRLLAIIEPEEAFNKSSIPYLSHLERRKFALRKEKRFTQLAREHGWTTEDMQMAENLIGVPGQFKLHREMFLETLRSQTTDEQKKLFLEPAQNYEIIGCYAQTEYGHGSNVRELETTATWDPQSREFVIHSPTLTSAKCWIGGLGTAADHAIVMAQLFSDGKNLGPHPFIVPIRDRKTREPLPGRIVMDIGPKVGLNTVDNGSVIFDSVRIPHVNMMARFSRINADTGLYEKPKSAALAYGTMTYIRAGIVRQAGNVLASAATIAVRYCSIRRQFVDRDAPASDEQKPAETQVINYSSVQHRIFPAFCQALAFHFTARDMTRLYQANQGAIGSGDMSLFAETHASSCALKALCTITTADQLEMCRRACGGHGFSSAAGIGAAWADYLPQVTWEGDSYMLPQQTTRYLFKIFRKLWADPAATFDHNNATIDYLRKYIEDTSASSKIRFSGDLHDPAFFVAAFGHRAGWTIGTAVRKRDIERKTWNHLLVEILRCAKAHAEFLTILNWARALQEDEQLQSNKALLAIMSTCFELYATWLLDANAADFMQSGYLDTRQCELIRDRSYELLGEIRPQAVAIVDGFGLSDYYLNSALGRSDGHVYENLILHGVREPVNAVKYNTIVDDPEIVMGEPPLAKL